MNTWVLETLELLFSAFIFLLGYYLAHGGRMRVRKTLVVCAGMLGAYWAIFVPRLVYLRVTGLSDIGRMTILREAFCLRSSVVPFAGYIGGTISALLLMLLLTRIPKVSRVFSTWLMVVMPITVCEVLRFYAPQYPEFCAAARNLQLCVCCVGAGCVLGQTDDFCPVKAGRLVRAAIALLVVAGHYALPQITVGAMQLLGNRVSFTFDLDAVYLPVLFFAWQGKKPYRPAVRAEGAEKPYFDGAMTRTIKGLCVVMMFVHHFFTFPEWYVEGISYPGLVGFAELFQYPLAACVPVFAFITGYFYAFNRRQTLRYSLEKIAGTLNVYWVIQALLYVLAAVAGAKLSLGVFLWELVGLENQVMTFNWYIAFYIMAMLMLPALVRLPQKNVFASSMVMVALPVAGATAVRVLAAPESHAALAAQYVLDGVTGLGAGYLTARYGLFAGLDRGLGKRRGLRVLAAAVLGVMAFLGRKFAPRLVISLGVLPEEAALRVSMDVVYAPVLVYAMANVLPALPGIIRRMLGEMGKYALHMWLISCVFFNVGQQAYQGLLYLPKHPVLVTLWGLALCYAAARAVDLLCRAWNRIKKFLFSSLQIRKNRV